MMGGGKAPNLKGLKPANRVQSLSHCKDTYVVTTADGQRHKFWERNLRLKTDAIPEGPKKDMPALVGAGMMGDRADATFADPTEISGFIAAMLIEGAYALAAIIARGATWLRQSSTLRLAMA